MSVHKRVGVVASATGGMVMSDRKRHHRYSAHFRLWGVLIFCVLVFAGIVGALYAVREHRDTNSSTTSTAAKRAVTTPPAGTTPDQQAQYYADEGQYQDAEKSWNAQLAGATDTSAKIAIYYQQAAVAIQFKKYGDAKNYADDIKQLSPDAPDSYVVLAQLAQAQNNIPQAKQYWQQAIDHVNPNTPGSTMIKSDYTNQRDALK